MSEAVGLAGAGTLSHSTVTSAGTPESTGEILSITVTVVVHESLSSPSDTVSVTKLGPVLLQLKLLGLTLSAKVSPSGSVDPPSTSAPVIETVLGFKYTVAGLHTASGALFDGAQALMTKLSIVPLPPCQSK